MTGRILAVAALAAAIVGVASAFAMLREPTPVASSRSTAPGVSIIFGHRFVTDVGPGGMPVVVTDAFDKFVVMASDGTRGDYDIPGLAVGTPVFDGTRQLAYWTRPSLHDAISRLAVWSLGTAQERTLLELSDLVPWSAPVWTTDGRTIIVVTLDRASQRARLLRVDVGGAGAKTLLDVPAANAIGPIYADADRIVGLRRPASTEPSLIPASNYVVLDARTGVVRTEAPTRQPSGELIAAPDGTISELVRNFESDSGPLRIWSVDDPTRDLRLYDARGLDTPRFWPGRSEIVFVDHVQIVALDYRTGATRGLFGGEPTRLVGFDASGEMLVFSSRGGYHVAERSATYPGLVVRDDARFSVPRSPQDVLEPLAVVR